MLKRKLHYFTITSIVILIVLLYFFLDDYKTAKEASKLAEDKSDLESVQHTSDNRNKKKPIKLMSLTEGSDGEDDQSPNGTQVSPIGQPPPYLRRKWTKDKIVMKFIFTLKSILKYIRIAGCMYRFGRFTTHRIGP